MGLCEASDFTLSSLSVVLVIVEIFAHILTATVSHDEVSRSEWKRLQNDVRLCFLFR